MTDDGRRWHHACQVDADALLHGPGGRVQGTSHVFVQPDDPGRLELRWARG